MLVYSRSGNLRLFVMIFLIITLLISIFHAQASATELSGVPLKDKINIHGTEIDYDLESDIPRYSDLYTQYLYAGASPARDRSIPLNLHDARSDENISLSLGKAMTSDKEDSLIWDDGQEYFEWDFVVENQGLYEIEVEYLNLIGDSTIIQRQLYIDGEIPFFEAGNIMFYSNWVEEAPVSDGNDGDQIAPALKEMPKWKTISLADGTGMQIDPYQFYFMPGNHSLKLVMLSQPIAIKRISIIPSRVIPEYTEDRKSVV